MRGSLTRTTTHDLKEMVTAMQDHVSNHENRLLTMRGMVGTADFELAISKYVKFQDLREAAGGAHTGMADTQWLT